MKIEIHEKILENWGGVLGTYNKYGDNWNDELNQILGKLWWTCPDTVLWLYATDNEEDYEGSQTQLGVKQDGTVVWGYFSHCSCFGYDDYDGEFTELKEENEIHTLKTYEMENVEPKVLSIMKDRLTKIVKEMIG